MNDETEFYGENHINVITGGNIQKISESLANSKTSEFIKYFIGNGALSKSEIENILPIFED